MRIHFTGSDLVRTRVPDRPDPLWEVVLSLRLLRSRHGAAIFDGWRRASRKTLHDAGLSGVVRDVLFPLTPEGPYLPDFLTPPEGLLGLAEGLGAIRATPAPRLRRELERLALPEGRSPVLDRLAEGDREALEELARALEGYHHAALAPYWDRISTAAEIDSAGRGRLQRTGGTEALLAGFWPMMRWRPPVLEVPRHPVRRDLHLRGRGLLLIPSYFGRWPPVAPADPALPPVLVYPLRPASDLLAAAPAGTADPPLARLLGASRARVLAVIGASATTSEIARRAGVSVPTASRHAAALRDCGLITSRRHANAIIHDLTPLGAALLGEIVPAGHRSATRAAGSCGRRCRGGG